MCSDPAAQSDGIGVCDFHHTESEIYQCIQPPEYDGGSVAVDFAGLWAFFYHLNELPSAIRKIACAAYFPSLQ